MLSFKQDALLLSLRPFDTLQLVPEADDRHIWSGIDRSFSDELTARAAQALSLPLPCLKASDYLRFASGTDNAWADAYTVLREQLKALVMGACATGGDRFILAAADRIYALCDQTDWAMVSPQPDFPDDTHELIDVQACETGALLAAASRLLKSRLDKLSPRIRSRIYRTLDARLMDPLINYLPERWHIAWEALPRVCAALMSIAFLLERDDRRRWLMLRQILKMLDAFSRQQPDSGGYGSGLENHLDQAMALNDCFSILSAASGGEVELRDDPAFVNMARSFVTSHICQGWFLNPGGQSMRPRLSPDLLFRLGESARVDALCSLAAYLYRVNPSVSPSFHESTQPLLQQVMNALERTDLMGQTARAARPEYAGIEDMPLLSGRMDDFYAALTGPCGGKSASGDMILFYQDKPVILSLSDAQSVPVVSGMGQLSGRGAQDAQRSDGPGWQMLSMNTAQAYPKAAGVVNWQRTWMLSPFEGGPRLMEVFDLDMPGKADFCFLTPDLPRIQTDCVLLMNERIAMTYDRTLTVRLEPVNVSAGERRLWGSHVYRIVFSAPEPVSGGNYAFLFRPTGKGGGISVS